MLLIDIGNSRIKWRVAAAAPANREPVWLAPERAIAVADARRLEEAFRTDAMPPIDSALISNVASSEIERLVTQAVSRSWDHASIRHAHSKAAQCGVVNGYRDPSRLGPDRWLALIAAHALAPDRAVLVCSFGTATTIDLLEPANEVRPGHAVFVGGLILPGIEGMRHALASGTARLSSDVGNLVDFAVQTDDAISSGIVAAQIGAVERAVRAALARQAQRSTTSPLTCIAAGGGAAGIAALLADLGQPLLVAHDLVLRGLAVVASEASAIVDNHEPAAITDSPA